MAAAVPEGAGEGELSGGLRTGDGGRGTGACATRLDGMPGAGRDTARLARSVEKVEETRKMWSDQLDRCGELRIELVAELAKIQHPLAQEVLRRRYMNGESYAEICDALALVERRVYQLHRLGVNKVCEPENGG